jgi:hypothetical protein
MQRWQVLKIVKRKDAYETQREYQLVTILPCQNVGASVPPFIVPTVVIPVPIPARVMVAISLSVVSSPSSTATVIIVASAPTAVVITGVAAVVRPGVVGPFYC